MASNAQKTPLAPSLNEFTRRKALDAIQQLGKALPCSVVSVQGQIVTVKFEVASAPWTLPNVTMPIATSIYDWLPIQAGDKGYATPADVYMGGISGLGGGVADLTQRGNLSTLVFVPVSNASWAVPGGDPNMRVVQGPDGVRIQDTAGKTTIVLTAEGVTITLQPGDNLSVTGSSGSMVVLTNCDITSNGVDFLSHVHSGVSPGDGDTGPPVS